MEFAIRSSRSARAVISAGAVVAALVLALLLAPGAGAASVHPFKETFGAAAQPTFGHAEGLAIDQTNDRLLVIDAEAGTVSRFGLDGNSAEFTVLGGNAIDGREGPGGKPCGEEPASCDQTPQNGLSFASAAEVQVAVDNSGSATDGNIYVTQAGGHLIDIFAEDGAYLGQLTAAGSEPFGETCGVAVDQSGSVYVGDFNLQQIHRFVPTGNPPTDADFAANFQVHNAEGLSAAPCTVAAGAGASDGALFAAQLLGPVFRLQSLTGDQQAIVFEGSSTTVTVDPTSGNLLVASGESIFEYDGSDPSSPLLGTTPLASAVEGIAVDGAGNVYVSRQGAATIEVLGPPVPLPTVASAPATELLPSSATLNGSLNAEGLPVIGCFFEYGTTTSYGSTAPCEEPLPSDSSDHPVSAKITGLEPNGTTYHFRLVAENANGTERSSDETFTTTSTVVTEAASDLTISAATLHGTVFPEGDPYTGCEFEYGPVSVVGFEASVPCSPAATSIPADFDMHPVTATLTSLQPNTTYRYRLVATDAGGTVAGAVRTFTTLGAPQISDVRALSASRDAATVEAKVNPRGFATEYRFEWGPTPAYGNVVPAGSEESVGAGTAPVRVTAALGSLSPATLYHYRVVAISEAGTTASADHVVETLGACGLLDSRCFELVSPRDKGPVAAVKQAALGADLQFQAAAASPSPAGPGVAYNVANGLPGTTTGAEVLYLSTRHETGWTASQLSPPLLAPGELKGESSASGRTQALSSDLSCGVVVSGQPLSADAPRAVIAAGGSNLYRRKADGSFTVVSNLPPLNADSVAVLPLESEYLLAGMSAGCERIVFTSPYRYSGLPGSAAANGERLYVWEEGTLRSIGTVPGPGGEEESGVVPGAGRIVGGEVVPLGNHFHAVSADGSRVFITAPRLSGPPAELGVAALFARDSDGVTTDVSSSATATPSNGALFQAASADGSRVFFTANYGLTAPPQQGGTSSVCTEASLADECDLYEYDFTKPSGERLTDLSASSDPGNSGGAAVAGVLGTSADGSRVYFAARGQLVPGAGADFAENVAANTFSVYGAAGGALEYVGTVTESDLTFAGVTLSDSKAWTSRISPDGRYLVFASRADVTGYESGGAVEAYLHDAVSARTVCVSCRPDGLPSLATSAYQPLAPASEAATGATAAPLHPPLSLTVRDGQARVFFRSPDALTTGAMPGQTNLYEWAHDQVGLLATEPPGLADASKGLAALKFAGASADGTDVYFTTTAALNWEDSDGRSDIYDARSGGGFRQPAAGAAPCDTLAESSCQGPPPAARTAKPPSTSSFAGPGNCRRQKAKKRRHQGGRHHRHGKRQAQGKRHQQGAKQRPKAGKKKHRARSCADKTRKGSR